MNDTDLSRVCATRLRTVCTLATVLAATLVLTASPALAATHRRRGAPHRRSTRGQHRRARRHASLTRRPSHPSSRCRDANVRIGEVPRNAIERATVCLLNRQRTERGLPRMRGNAMLVHSAQSWTNTMVHDRAFSHGSDFGARISAAGFDWSQIGENIADGYRTAAGAVTAWMRSLGHCQNILDPEFREVGVGFDDGSAVGGELLRGTWTLDFALGMHQRARSDDWTPAEGCPYPR